MDINLFENYHPHEKQIPFHKSKARFKAIAAGIRAGKTYSGAREFMKRIYEDRARKKGRLLYWIVAPDYSLTEVAQQEIFDILGGDESPLIKKWNIAKLKLQLHGDITIRFKSAERPEKLVSAALDGFWVDETARCSAVTWANLRGRVADKQGWGLFTTSPMGANWFYEEIYRLGDKTDELYDPDFASFLFKTVDNTAVPGMKEEVEKARKQMNPKYFKRDFEASFNAFLGQIYDEFDRSTHVIKHQVIEQWLQEGKFKRFVIGKDWGSTNPGVSLVIGIDGDDNYYIIEEVYKTDLLILAVDNKGHMFDCWIKRDKELIKKYSIYAPVETIWADPSEKEYISTYRSQGVKAIRKADNSVDPGIQEVANLMHINPDTGKPRFFISDRCPNAIRETEGYRRAEVGKDKELSEDPLKKDDHACDAYRYGIYNDMKLRGKIRKSYTGKGARTS